MNFAPDLLNPETFQHLKCETCGGWQVLDETSFVRIVDGIKVRVQDLPILRCDKCDLIRLPAKSRVAILHHVAEAKKAGEAGVIVTRKPEAQLERFG